MRVCIFFSLLVCHLWLVSAPCLLFINSFFQHPSPWRWRPRGTWLSWCYCGADRKEWNLHPWWWSGRSRTRFTLTISSASSSLRRKRRVKSNPSPSQLLNLCGRELLDCLFDLIDRLTNPRDGRFLFATVVGAAVATVIEQSLCLEGSGPKWSQMRRHIQYIERTAGQSMIDTIQFTMGIGGKGLFSWARATNRTVPEISIKYWNSSLIKNEF